MSSSSYGEALEAARDDFIRRVRAGERFIVLVDVRGNHHDDRDGRPSVATVYALDRRRALYVADQLDEARQRAWLQFKKVPGTGHISEKVITSFDLLLHSEEHVRSGPLGALCPRCGQVLVDRGDVTSAAVEALQDPGRVRVVGAHRSAP